MLVWFYFFLIAISLLILAIVLLEFISAIDRFRGPRVVTCPADGKRVGVEIDPRKAAAAKVRGRGADYEVTRCTSWPEREGCGRGCMHELEGDPDMSLLKNQLADWFAVHDCALCGRSIFVIPPEGTGPGFLTADQKSINWREIPLDDFPDSLGRHAALCEACMGGGNA